MKRFFTLVLSVLLIVSLVSCSSSLEVEKTGGGSVSDTHQALTKNETKEMETVEYTLPEGFSVGYSRKVVNPLPGTSLGGFPGANKRLSKLIVDDIMLSCIAISDGENVLLLFSSDSIHVGRPFAESVAKIAEEVYGIHPDNLVMNATHTHSGPSLYTTSYVGIEKYVNEIYYPAAEEMMGEALLDLAPAQIQVGKAQTEGLNYVRRYVNLVTGKYAGKNIEFNSDASVYAHETEADHEMQVIRFERGEKKDILLCNWQCHATHVGTSEGTTVSSDFIGPFRKEVEKREDVHFFYLQGAAGNVTPNGRIAGENRNKKYKEHGAALADRLFAALENTITVSSGKVQVKKLDLTIPFSEEYCLEENKPIGTETTMGLYALSFGDICIGTVPGEWHDTLGMELKEKSPYAITLVGAYTNGANGYFPASFAFENGGYEVNSTRHDRGTAERFLSEILNMLGELYPTRLG